MNTFEKLNTYWQYFITYMTDTVFSTMTALALDPGLTKLVCAIIIVLPLIGIALRSLDTENRFFLYVISRWAGTLILYGMLILIMGAAIALCYTYFADLSIDSKHYSKLYLTALKLILDPAIDGASIGLACGLLFYIFSRTFYTKCLTNIGAKLTWSTSSARGVPTENDINCLQVKKVNQPQLKSWLRKAHKSNKVFIGVNNKTAKPIFIPVK